ncbi:MAG: cation-translocating P-type ATPase [Desulfobacteraceae bacterium]|nr:cation-translocating P-type ATPase [Desulfobacteraceae bacterium]
MAESFSDDSCRLCGLPAGRANISLHIAGETVRFCCLGCMYVFQILHNSPEGLPEDCRDTDLYRACVASGLIPSDSRPEADPEPARPPGGPGSRSGGMDAIRDGLSKELSVRIEGMWCTACSWLIEQIVRKLDGVVCASIFFFSDIARITYMPHRTDPRTIIEAISRLGYRAAPVDAGPESAGSGRLAVRLGISAILSINIMMISFALYYGFFEDIGRDGAAFFSYPLWAMATPVVFYGGWPILRKAFWGLRHFVPTMDLLIAAGALSAYLYSVFAMLRGSLHVYFDTASMLMTLVLLGKFIELRAREKISAGITTLFHAVESKVRIVSRGKEVWTASEEVRPGDSVVVFPGERVPVDGRIVSGSAVLDESIVTGESRPAAKATGAQVPAGALFLGGDARFEAMRPGNESSLSQMVSLIQEALAAKNGLELFADRLMRMLVPLVLLTAAGVTGFLLLASAGPEEAIFRGLTVLVITCPCALGIATPLSRVAAISRARESGILIRNASALERAGELGAFVFDKTGTLTEGKYTLREIIVPDGDETEALRRIASAEAKSDHFLAGEIVRAARARNIELHEALSFEPLAGLGITALFEDGEVVAGNRPLMARFGLSLPPELEKKAGEAEASGMTSVYFAWSGAIRGLLIFGDKVRPGAAEAVSRLKSDGLEVWIVSGDSEATTRAVAKELGIENCAGQAIPADKAGIIKGLQARGIRVAMAGDGINDAAALAQSDIGISVGTGANLVRECSDAAVFGEDPVRIAETIGLARFSSKIARQNLFFAFFYNVVGIPLAIAGALTPLIAASAMFASSATVICNTLRITGFRRTGPNLSAMSPSLPPALPSAPAGGLDKPRSRSNQFQPG